MAKDPDLFDKLRARGLRKSAANNLAKAFGKADSRPPSKGAKRAVAELRSLVAELEDRARGGPAKRKATAKVAKAPPPIKAYDVSDRVRFQAAVRPYQNVPHAPLVRPLERMDAVIGARKRTRRTPPSPPSCCPAPPEPARIA